MIPVCFDLIPPGVGGIVDDYCLCCQTLPAEDVGFTFGGEVML